MVESSVVVKLWLGLYIQFGLYIYKIITCLFRMPTSIVFKTRSRSSANSRSGHQLGRSYLTPSPPASAFLFVSLFPFNLKKNVIS